MPPQQSVPSACVLDAVARLAGDGSLAPASDAMRAWSAKFGACLEDLPLDASQRASLEDGAAVTMSADGESWQLLRRVVDGEAWLVARDVTDLDRAAAAAQAASRCRSLGKVAASLSHDLNNQFNAALALSTEISFLSLSEREQQNIANIERGVKVGARMAGALARLLTHVPARREKADLGALVEDALSVVHKSAEHAGVQVEVTAPEALPAARVVEVEVVQALMESVGALVDLGPERLSVVVSEQVSAGARPRPHVVARFEAHGVDPARASAVVEVVEVCVGSLDRVVADEGGHGPLMNAALLHLRLGGELRAAVDGDRLSLEFWWPAAR